jgi:YVTN family beta-propeller protein
VTLDRDRVARALPGYEVENEVGRGAWGVVLGARHRQLDRPVAIKELPEAFAADPTVRRRFVREAKLLATLDHPHVVPIYDYVESEGLCLLVMELLSGGSVWQRFTTTGVSADAACGIVVATCSALDYAHGKGILHRDIKPENLLFTEAGALKVSDFGIAKVVGGAESMATRTGEVLGTPAYMAPEQALGHDLTASTDVYAVGTLLYELLSGRLPFSDDGNAIAVLYRHAHEDPVPLTSVAPEVPHQLAEVAMQALERDPRDRFATAEDFGVALVDSATATWGAGWVRRGGVNVMATGRIGERISTPDGASGEAAIASQPAHRASSVRAPETVAESGAGVAEVAPNELVPVQEVIPADTASPPADAGPSAAAETVPPAQTPLSGEAVEPAPTPRNARRRRAPLFIAGAIVLVIVAVAAGVLLTRGGGGSSTERPSTTPSVAATVTIGPGADHVAGGGGIWATNSASGAVLKIDPTSNAVSPIASLTPPPHAIAAVNGTLWVTTSSGGPLVRIEPGGGPSQTRTTNVPVDTQLAEVAADANGVWASAPTAGQLMRVDPKTNQVVARVDVGSSPDSVAIGEGGVWVANRLDAGTVTRVDPAGDRVVTRVPVGSRPDQVAVGEGSVWVANSGDGTVSRIDPNSNKVSATISVGESPQFVVVGEGAVWVSEQDAGRVSVIDPSTNKVTATVSVGPGPESSAVGGGSVWVVNTGDGTLSKITR